MELKNYQQNTLAVLRRFFENCRVIGAEAAYKKITGEPDIKKRLGNLHRPIVEYKGGITATLDDTKTKTNIGELWEKYSQGRGLFLIVEKMKDGFEPYEQLREKIA